MEFGPFLRAGKVSSTQDEARAHPVGTVVVADEQTAGRGRLGRRWHSPPGSALLASVVLPADPLWTLRASVALVSALDDTGIRSAIKWPNDVLVDESKLAGILAEMTSDGKVILGFGVNLRQNRGELGSGATSLALLGVTVGRDELLTGVLSRLDRTDWFGCYADRCATIGRRVRVDLGGEVLCGRCQSVEADGALIVDGRRIIAGDVVHLRDA